MTGRRWLGAVMAAHLALGLVYAWATPIFEASDEGAHFAVVWWLAGGNGLPVQDPNGPSRPWHQEGSQPPLYYALAAALVRGIDMPDYEAQSVPYPLSGVGKPGILHGVNLYRRSLAPQPLAGTWLAVQVARQFSLVLSVGTIALTYALAMSIYPGREWLALLAAALAAFNPMALFINASVNNDNLLMPLSTAALLAMLPLMRQPTRGHWRRAAALGVLLGLAGLTKISGLVLWPLAGLALAVGAARTSAPGHSRSALAGLAGRVLLMFAVALVICGAWYWRNQQLYGEWLGLNTMVAVAGPRVPETGIFDLVRTEWRGFVLSFWAVFGVYTILPAPWVQVFFDILVVLALVGGAITMVRGPGRPSAEKLLLALFCLMTLASVVRWTLQTPASQGRLMFGAIAPLSIFLAAGLLAVCAPLLQARAGRQWARGPALAVTGALALVAGVVPVAYIRPSYAPPPVLAEADLPADLRPVHAVLADQIELVGYTAGDEAVRPGEAVSVTLYWRGLAPMVRDYALALHVLGRESQEVARLDTWPGGGLAATSQWTPGSLIADTYYLDLAADAAVPTKLRLDLYLWDEDPLAPLPRTTLAGEALPSVTLDIGRAVPRLAGLAEPEHAAASVFEHGIMLVGYDVSAHSTGSFVLTLYWQLDADTRVPADYTVFVHAVDEQGGLLHEPADGPPLNGDWPTSAWQPGHTVADTRLVTVPPNLRPGAYDVRVGLYNPGSGVRLAAWQADGTAWPDNAVVLPRAIVK